MRFFWGMLLGAFLGAIGTMWYVQRQMNLTTPAEAVAAASSNDIPADFLDFYERFHGDSLYQINHIVFPLQGLPAYADSLVIAANNFRFQQEEWVLHKEFQDNDGQFERKFKNLGAGFMVEQIEDPENGLGMQRRFAKRGEEWFLIYYAEMNFVGG